MSFIMITLSGVLFLMWLALVYKLIESLTAGMKDCDNDTRVYYGGLTRRETRQIESYAAYRRWRGCIR